MFGWEQIEWYEIPLDPWFLPKVITVFVGAILGFALLFRALVAVL